MILFRCTSNYGTIRKDSDLFGTVFYKSNGVHLFDANTLFTLQCLLFRPIVLLPVATNHESESISEGGSSSLGAILGALFAFIILGAIVAGVAYYLIR